MLGMWQCVNTKEMRDMYMEYMEFGAKRYKTAAHTLYMSLLVAYLLYKCVCTHSSFGWWE